VIKIEFMMSTWTTNGLKMWKDNNEECKWDKKKIGKREISIIAIVVVVLWYVD
jgi:hypothetical protein